MPVHLPPLPSLREVLRIYGIRAQKQLSQNFLLQPASLNSFVKCAGSLKNAYVLEVGPGPGGITRSILKQGPRHLTVVELDRRFLPGLEEIRMAALEAGITMDVFRQDILKFSTENIFPPEAMLPSETWSSLSEPDTFTAPKPAASDQTALVSHCWPPPRIRVLGNLPFKISTTLVTRWLHDIAEKRGLWRHGRVPMILSFQKEVADRLVADVWSDQRSRLSVMAQAYCEVEYLKTIPSTAFLPVPKVDAAVVRLTPLTQPLIPSVPFPYVEKLVRCAFQFRGKQVVRGLEALFPSDRPDLVIQLFKEAGVQPMKRPTQLSILEFRDLCTVYDRICRKEPGLFNFDFLSRAHLNMWRQRKNVQREVLGDNQSLTAEYIRRNMYAPVEDSS